jgi:hypothetical protein
MSQIFPTKFVADVGTLELSASDTQQVTLTVGGVTVLSETYSPANGTIIIRGLRSVLEAAIYGNLDGAQSHASAAVQLKVGTTTYIPPGGNLFASRLRNPRDPSGNNTILAAGDLVAVASASGFITPAKYCRINNTDIRVETVSSGTDKVSLGNGITLWIERTACPEKAVAVRFLNRYDVPQTMMTPEPLQVKPGFQDQTSLMYGNRVRYAVEQNDEYTLHSGKIHSESEYASWSDLVTSRKAEVLMNGQWLPILITKANYTQVRRSIGMNRVEISFKMADPRQGL